MPYQLIEPVATRQKDFLGDSGSVESELAILRWCLEQAVNQGNTKLSSQIAGQVGKLELVKLEIDRKKGSLLQRETLVAVGNTIAQLVFNELQGLPGAEQIFDNLVPALATAIESAGRTQHLLPAPR
jgi:hypothetical protein